MRIRVSVWGILAFAIGGCAATPKPSGDAHTPAHWSYDGADGPAQWGKLDPEYAACAYGTTQSPVDIVDPRSEALSNVVFHYHASTLKIRNTGHAVEASFDEGSSIEANGESYDLVRLELHVPSEHRIHGKPADAEVQLFHRNTSGQLAAIAVLLKIGSEDTTLRAVWDNIPLATGVDKIIEGTINVEDILPARRLTYRYEGSLTAPPCSEIVSWLVMREPMHVSARQLARFIGIFGKNSRPVQPLNQRTIIQESSLK